MWLLCLAAHAGAGSRVEPAEVALRYVRACQDGAWDEVVKMTAWMRDRLDRVSAKEASSAKREAVVKELSDSLRQRTAEGNRLRTEGIEDVYLFAPGATVRLLRTDAGRTDLDRPVCGRAWLEVTYPTREKAPRDEKGRAIRSLVVGLNASGDGLILKARVLGNADIDVHSITYRWDEAGG
ncbi:MAG: hypothetical protein NTU83_12565 [Candidatus Hydrogenedentes bacterium]|nr:hypothetical protein [Candidatus Hydrogenedentota bacterium]